MPKMLKALNQLPYTNPYEPDVRFTCPMQLMHVVSRLHSLQARRLVGRWGVGWGGGGGGRESNRAEPTVGWVGAGGQGLYPHPAQLGGMGARCKLPQRSFANIIPKT